MVAKSTRKVYMQWGQVLSVTQASYFTYDIPTPTSEYAKRRAGVLRNSDRTSE